ncbi:little elongation complex subunit 2-like [Coccinella septempunctata]|uniref:little elongation complex subunit 2-like n=1 Tax=Coccinella septempunctata TaxID=41139 RepID=UPI001D0945B5|nr:little elongation complex subunit 2-like [Coccinella septempunctata]
MPHALFSSCNNSLVPTLHKDTVNRCKNKREKKKLIFVKMDEFLRLKWDSTSNKSYLEKQVCTFVTNECLLESYVYQNLRKQLNKPQDILLLNNEVNFIPGGKYSPQFPRKSLLTREQQEQCLSAIKLLVLNKPSYQLKQTESFSIEVFKSLNCKIAEEHKMFNEFVKHCWESDKGRIGAIKNNLYRYACILNKKKIRRYLEYKRYYKEEDLINMSYNEDETVTIEVNCMQNLLELGTLARFSHPSLKFECRLSAQTLPSIQPIRFNSKMPVSKDGNIRQLLKNNDFDIVISSSGLKRLLDNTDLKEKWTIPVVVELINVQRGREIHKKKVVFIDKPFVKNRPDPLDLKYISMKRLVRTNFCHYEAFKYENQEICFEENKCEQTKINGCDGNSEDNLEEKLPWKKKSGSSDLIHHNVNYRLWKVRKNVNSNTLLKNQMKNTELNLLIRSKLDACEVSQADALQPVIIKPKVELQLQYGANIPTKSELSREWTSLFFRPFSNLYRVRTHWNTAEVVNLEKCSIQKVANEANQLYQYKPYLGLGVLNDVLTKLVELSEGSYLLAHLPKHGSFVSLLKECESVSHSLDLHSEYTDYRISDIVERNWVPIDLNYILPIHESQNRPPGCFMPPLQGKHGNFKKKNKPTLQQKKPN